MSTNKKTVTLVSFSLIFALGIGIAIGSSLAKKGASSDSANIDNAKALKDVNWESKSVEELSASLSEVMLPEDEFTKLQTAIFQTAMGLFAAQTQSAGVTITDDAQQELKKSVDDKYSRKYFADMNANSMKELSKEELISVLSFYNTEAGVKFLKLSPKIIQSTMTAVQADLSSWLPKTVDALVAKLKGGKPEENAKDPAEDNAAPTENNDEGKAKS